MKSVILAGGLGTRIAEETHSKPKPMIEIGGKPILWHIMKTYSHYGINEFIICCGYKGYLIKEYFSNYFLHTSDITFDMANNRMEVHQRHAEPWQVTLVDTGERTMTGGRLKRIAPFVADEEIFCFTYGDCVSDLNIADLITFHKKQKTLTTLTATYPPARFGVLSIHDDNRVMTFKEKPRGDGSMINGGFFVASPEILDLLADDSTVWEEAPMKKLVAKGQLSAFRHFGFWQPMDTLRDKVLLEELWAKNQAPWKVWQK